MARVTSGWRAGISESEAQLTTSLKAPALLRVFLPSRDRSGRPLAPFRVHRVVLQKLLNIAGGATTLPGVGSWISGTGKPVHEPVEIVESYLPALDAFARRDLVEFLHELALATGQEALAVGINGRLLLLSGRHGVPTQEEFLDVASGS